MYTSPQVIVWEQESGVLALCFPTEEMQIEQVAQKDCPVEAVIKNRSELPFDYFDFYEAWILLPDNSVVIDINRAKELTKNRLRFEREPLFAPLDAAYMKALERNQDTTEIVAKKQMLRDLTSLADGCTSLDELRQLKAVL